MYKVIKFFTDLQDGKHPYYVGDKFPREGVTVSEERIAELASSKNKQKTPLIALDESVSKSESAKTAPKKTTKRKK